MPGILRCAVASELVTVATSTTLLDALVEASGLSSVFAHASIVRALKRSGAELDRLTRADVLRAMPEIERALSVYIDAAELQGRMRQLKRVL